MRSSTPSRISGFAGTKLSSFTFKTYNKAHRERGDCIVSKAKNAPLLRNIVIYLTFPSNSEMIDSFPEVVIIFPSSQFPFGS